MTKLNTVWYQDRVILWPFLPLSQIYSICVRLRRLFYEKRDRLFKAKTSIPIIVVGNITVGGTGKTPLVIYIAELLQQQGFKPGLLSRGYKGSHREPTQVNAKSDPKCVGDEPVLLVKRLQCPMVVGRNRLAALENLRQNFSVDVVISDDGLQHYPLPRHIEIAVIDGERRFGNGYCLPVGPLREPKSRLKEVDFIVANGGIKEAGEYQMECTASFVYNACHPENPITLEAFKSKQGEKVHAVAGLGNPNRFFQLLESFGLSVIQHVFPDHYPFSDKDIIFADNLPVILTEKDAVKCMGFMGSLHWVLPIGVKINPLFDTKLLNRLKELCNG